MTARWIILTWSVFLGASFVEAQPRQPHYFLEHDIGLSDDEIRKAEQGEVVVKVLDLISINRSRSDGLTGFFGSIVRSQAVKRAREGLAGVLANGKTNLEAGYKRAAVSRSTRAAP